MKFRLFITALLSAVVIFGCDQKPESTETQTEGRIVVTGSDGAVKMMRRQSQRFMALYPKSEIVIAGGGSKLGIAALNEGRARIAVVSRDLTSEEDSVIRLNGGKAKGYKIAHDGLAVIVNSGNSVRQLTFEQLEKIFTAAGPQGQELFNRTVSVLQSSLNTALMQVFTAFLILAIFATVANIFLTGVPGHNSKKPGPPSVK